MSETVQNIIVAIILAAAVAWSIWRIFFAKKSGCNCGGTASPDCSSCSNCQLANTCRKFPNSKD